MADWARPGLAWYSLVRRSKARQAGAGLGMVGHGIARLGRLGVAWRGRARYS